MPAIVAPGIGSGPPERMGARSERQAVKVIKEIIEYLYTQDRLSDADIRYLQEEGFLERPEPEDGDDWSPVENEDLWHLMPLDFVEADLEEKAPRKKRGRPPQRKGALTARQIAERIGQAIPGWEAPLESLLTLARQLDPAAVPESAPRVLIQAHPDALLEALAFVIGADSSWFPDLWYAVEFDEYRACGGDGPAGAAYRALLTGADPAEIGRYLWITRHAAVSRVYTLVRAQRTAAGACGRLYRARFEVVDRYLARTYHSPVFWPYVLLHNACCAGESQTADAVSSRSLPPHECLLPEASLPGDDELVRAWVRAIKMDREAVLPFLIRAGARGDAGPGPALHCPQAWYRPY